MRGSANEYSCTQGAQINFRDLTPYLTFSLDTLSSRKLPISLLSGGLLVHWSSKDEGGKAAWDSFTVNILRKKSILGSRKMSLYNVQYVILYMQYTLQLRGQIVDTRTLFLLSPSMYSVEYIMSGTSEHNRAKSRTTSHTTFLCIYCSVSSPPTVNNCCVITRGNILIGGESL